MAKVIYRGSADVRKLAKKDFAKHGVEDFTATEFKRGEVTEVSSEVAKILLDSDNQKTFGKFAEEEAAKKPEAASSDVDTIKKASSK